MSNDEIPRCPKCGIEMDWVDCGNCDEGYSEHDCGEDCCCCADPYPNVVCDICEGKTGWYSCLECAEPEWVDELLETGRI